MLTRRRKGQCRSCAFQSGVEIGHLTESKKGGQKKDAGASGTWTNWHALISILLYAETIRWIHAGPVMSMRPWRATSRNAVVKPNRFLWVCLKPRCCWNNRSRSYNQEHRYPCFWVQESGNAQEALNAYRSILKNAVKDDFKLHDFLFPGKQQKSVELFMDRPTATKRHQKTPKKNKTPAKKQAKKWCIAVVGLESQHFTWCGRILPGYNHQPESLDAVVL